jgi:hypothetical protein
MFVSRVARKGILWIVSITNIPGEGRISYPEQTINRSRFREDDEDTLDVCFLVFWQAQKLLDLLSVVPNTTYKMQA